VQFYFFTGSVSRFSTGNSAHSFIVMPTYDISHCTEILHGDHQKTNRSRGNTAETRPCFRGITADSVPVTAVFYGDIHPVTAVLPSSPFPCSPLSALSVQQCLNCRCSLSGLNSLQLICQPMADTVIGG